MQMYGEKTNAIKVRFFFSWVLQTMPVKKGNF
jgi:hypothetical protein